MDYISNSLPIHSFDKENDAKEKSKCLPEFYSIDKIFKENIFIQDIKNKFNKAKSIINLKEYNFIERTHKKNLKNQIIVEIENKKEDLKKRGRKKESAINVSHTKMSSDNIMKKIKSGLINKYILEFLNEIINLKFKDFKLAKLDHKKYINEFRRKKN